MKDELNGKKSICDLFVESVAKFTAYNNAEEGFLDNPGNRKRVPEKPKFAITCRQRVQEANYCFHRKDDEQISFDYVDYEISPWRTTRSRFDDGKSAKNSGTGGIDLLLCCRTSRIPIVGEIKSRQEGVGPTFALIQALTYASELVTPNQWRRIEKSYPKQFGDLLSRHPDPVVDICLILEGTPNQEQDFQFMKTRAGDLVAHVECSKRIRRVFALTGKDLEGKIEFGCVFQISRNRA